MIPSINILNRYKVIIIYLFCFSLSFSTSLSAQEEGLKNSWEWQLESSSFYESKIAIRSKGKIIASYEFGCDLNQNQSALLDEDESSATIEKLQLQSGSTSLLIITCNIGAHSQQLSIVEPNTNPHTPIFEKTGSYFVRWKKSEDTIIITYDKPCKETNNKVCEVPFEAIKTSWTLP